MFIQLTEDRAIKSDDHGYCLCRRKVSKDGEKWEPYRYYGSFLAILENVPEQMLRESDAASIHECRLLLHEWRELLKRN